VGSGGGGTWGDGIRPPPSPAGERRPASGAANRWDGQGNSSNLTAVISSALDYKKFLDKRKQMIQLQVETAQNAVAASPMTITGGTGSQPSSARGTSGSAQQGQRMPVVGGWTTTSSTPGKGGEQPMAPVAPPTEGRSSTAFHGRYRRTAEAPNQDERIPSPKGVDVGDMPIGDEDRHADRLLPPRGETPDVGRPRMETPDLLRTNRADTPDAYARPMTPAGAGYTANDGRGPRGPEEDDSETPRGGGWTGPDGQQYAGYRRSQSGAGQQAGRGAAAASSRPQATGGKAAGSPVQSQEGMRPPSAGAPASLGTDVPRSSSNSRGRAQTPTPKHEDVEDLLGGDDGRITNSTATLDDYVVGKQVGQGAYATVRFALHKDSGKKVAIKVYEKYKLLDPQRRKSVRREVRLMERMNHANIVNFIDALDTPKQIYIVMEFLSGGSLHSFLKKRTCRRLEEPQARRLFVQVGDGLKYCHDRHIVHRDIKLENLLLDENQNVKIIDFGFSTIIPPGRKLKIFCGTPSYMAPEIVARKEYSGFCADIWAIGVLLYAMLCGCFPFKGANDRDLYRKIIKGVFYIPDFVSAGARSLLNRVLTVDMSKRPTIDDVLCDAWVTANGSEVFPNKSTHNSSISSTATTAAGHTKNVSSNDVMSLSLLPDNAQGQERPAHSGNGQGRPGTPGVPNSARDAPDDKEKPRIDDEAVAKLERLGYGRDEIIRQLRDEDSHLYKLYFRFLRALNAWDKK